jgi:hypothetical protein
MKNKELEEMKEEKTITAITSKTSLPTIFSTRFRTGACDQWQKWQ